MQANHPRAKPCAGPGEAKSRQRSAFTAADAARAGMLMLAVNGLCTGAGAGLGVLIGALVPLVLAGFFVGFGAAVWIVTWRFR
jgi:hypothetical protein